MPPKKSSRSRPNLRQSGAAAAGQAANMPIDGGVDDDLQRVMMPPEEDDKRQIRQAATRQEAVSIAVMEGCYDDAFAGWRGSPAHSNAQQRLEEYEMANNNSSRAYKFCWSGKDIYREAAVSLLSMLLTGKYGDKVTIDKDMTEGQRAFDCAGTAGSKGKSGGGTTVFLESNLLLLGDYHATYLADEKDADADDANTWLWEADLWPDTLNGQPGRSLGTVLGEAFQIPEMNIRTRNHLLTEKVREAVKDLPVSVQVKQVNHNRQSDKGDWATDVMLTGPGPAEREARKRLFDGVQLLWQGEMREFKLASKRTAAANNRATRETTFKRIEEEAGAEKGRRLHIYRLRTEIATDAELFKELLKECETHGTIERSGVKESRDGLAWAWIVYEDAESLIDALGADALEGRLCDDKFADGSVSVEESVWEESNLYKRTMESKVPTLDVGKLVPGRSYANITGDQSEAIRAVMQAREMQRQLTGSIVNPVVQQTVKKTKDNIEAAKTDIMTAIDKLTQEVKAMQSTRASKAPGTEREAPARRSRSRTRTANGENRKRAHKHQRETTPATTEKAKKRRSPKTQDINSPEAMIDRIRSTPEGSRLIDTFMFNTGEGMQVEEASEDELTDGSSDY